MQVIGNYSLSLFLGDTLLNVSPQMMEEFTITQDIDRLLPTFKLSIRDATKLLLETIPYDKSTNRLRVELAQANSEPSEVNIFNFAVKRRSTVSPGDAYTIEGVLDIEGILTEDRSKAFTGNLKTSIISIANNLGILTTEVGSSLSYDKSFLQPWWTDAKMLRYLKIEALGKDNEAGYHCHVKVVRGEPTLVFKSLGETLSGPVKFNLMVSHKEYEDYSPVSEYQIFDNSQLMQDFGAKTQSYNYFDYETGTYVEASTGVDDCPTLSEFLAIDDDNNQGSVLYTGTGRSNAFTADFLGRVKNDFHLRHNGFMQMWAGTWGLENAAPGDIVQVIFGEAFERGDLFMYQHSGLWMVKRVVHMVGNTFFTNLLLVRAGIDTDIDNTLKKSVSRQR